MRSITCRTIGAAVVDPNPPCSTIATTTYFGWYAGTIAANHEVSWNPSRSAVPVLPATGISPSGKPENASPAVPPDCVTWERPSCTM